MQESQGMQATRITEARRIAESTDVHEVMMIQCSQGHHLARVLATDNQHVLETHLQRHSHGKHDLHSDPHGVDEPSLWWDFLDPIGDTGSADPAIDDTIPVGCACGGRQLSRTAIQAWLAVGESRPIID